jgi:hypothetical protein
VFSIFPREGNNWTSYGNMVRIFLWQVPTAMLRGTSGYSVALLTMSSDVPVNARFSRIEQKLKIGCPNLAAKFATQ